MTWVKKILFITLFTIGIFALNGKQVFAQTCAPTRVINQFACVRTQGACVPGFTRWICSGNGRSCGSGDAPCSTAEGNCISYCAEYQYSNNCQTTGYTVVGCSGPPSCEANTVIKTCGGGAAPGSCVENVTGQVYGCWVNPGGGTPGSTPNPGGGGGACASCSDWCAGADQCYQAGGQHVGSRCSGGSCAAGTSPCAVCSTGGGGNPCTMEWQGGPSTMTVGQTAQFRLFARGALPMWQMHWRWNNRDRHNPGQTWPQLGNFSPVDTTGSVSIVNFTATTPGSSMFYVYMEDGDWRTNDLMCETTRPITVFACTPSCVANCGQANGCGGTCPTTDMGIPPAAPGNLSPANGSTVNVIGTSVNLSWSSPSALTDIYEVQVGNAANVASMCGSHGASCPTVSGTSTGYTLVNGVANYAYRVRAVNSTCGAQQGPWSAWTYFSVVGTISGSIYIDPTPPNQGGLGGACMDGGADKSLVNMTGSIDATGLGWQTASTTINGNTYSLVLPYWNPGNSSLTLNPGIAPNGEPWACTCPNGCSYGGISSPQANTNFYVQQDDLVNTGWWQVLGGSAYAGRQTGTAVTSYVPAFYCTLPGCKPYILGMDLVNTPDSAGVMVTGGGAVDSRKEPGNQISNTTQRNTQTVARGSVTTHTLEKYEYFWRESGILFSAEDNFATSSNNAQKPTSPSDNYGGYTYYRDGDMTIRSPWLVDSNEKIVIFVNGNLTISDSDNVGQLIQVQPGGFLLFAVKGDITIRPNVGNTNLSSLAANLEGVYVANGTITVETVGLAAGGDKRFIGAGNFIGWTNVVLQRDFDDGGARKMQNNTIPAQTFIARPDFMMSIPEAFLRSQMVWQETN